MVNLTTPPSCIISTALGVYVGLQSVRPVVGLVKVLPGEVLLQCHHLPPSQLRRRSPFSPHPDVVCSPAGGLLLRISLGGVAAGKKSKHS